MQNSTKDKIAGTLFLIMICCGLYILKNFFVDTIINDIISIYLTRIINWISLFSLFSILIIWFPKITKSIINVYLGLTLILLGYYISTDADFIISIIIIALIIIFFMFVIRKFKKYFILIEDYTVIVLLYFIASLIPFYIYVIFQKFFIPFFMEFSKGNQVGNIVLNNNLVGLLSLWIGHSFITKILLFLFKKCKYFYKIKIFILNNIIHEEELKCKIFYNFTNRIVLLGLVIFGLLKSELHYVSTYFVIYSVFKEKDNKD